MSQVRSETGTGPGHPIRTEELAFMREARVGRLGTVDATSTPSIVPFCFAIVGSDRPVIVSALDEKPKRVKDSDLARVRNILAHPEVCVVVDRYDEDWSQLAFVQAWGMARLLSADNAGHAEAVLALRQKYPQYRAMAIEKRDVILIDELRAHSWRANGRMFA